MSDTNPEHTTVKLDFPFARGDQTIDSVKVRRPRSGELRGLNIADLVQMNVAATAKLLGAELQNKLFDDFLQIHGGYGYMAEYEIGRAWADARVGRIYGGSSEIMREIIGRTL